MKTFNKAVTAIALGFLAGAVVLFFWAVALMNKTNTELDQQIERLEYENQLSRADDICANGVIEFEANKKFMRATCQ